MFHCMQLHPHVLSLSAVGSAVISYPLVVCVKVIQTTSNYINVPFMGGFLLSPLIAKENPVFFSAVLYDMVPITLWS